jgi:hypothetical protein
VRYCMSLESFNLLVELVHPEIEPDIVNARNHCAEPICAEIVVAIGIQYLAGGSYDDDLMSTFGVSKSDIYYCSNKSIKDVLKC